MKNNGKLLKTIPLALVGLLLMACAAGCGRQPQPEINFDPLPGAMAQTITTPEEFTETLTGWTSQLEAIASATSASYEVWEAGQAGSEEFLTEMQKINVDMQLLKKVSDLKTEFALEGGYEFQVYCDGVLHSYNNAKKDLNDFLVLAPELNDEQIKEMYASKVLENFREDLDLLKELLEL